MNKVFKTLLLLFLSVSAFAQSNLPSNLSSFNAFKLNPLNIVLKLPNGYIASHSPIISETWTSGANGLKTSYNPTTTISGDTLKINLTTSQIGQLSQLGTARLLVKFNGVYRLGADIKISTNIGVPSTVVNTVNLPDLGIVNVSLIGDANTSKLYADIAKTAADSAKATLNSQWKNNNFVMAGTSIFFQYGANSIPAQAARMLGMAIYNESISGSKIMLFPGHSPGLSGTYGENAFAGQNNSYEYVITRYNGLVASPPFPEKAQLVGIAHAENDYPYLPDSLGTINDDKTNTFYGAYNRVIKRTLEANYNVKIFLCTPVSIYPYGVYSPGMDAAATAVRAIGKKWGIPVCDFAAEAGLNSITNVTGKGSSDGIHPNQATTDRLATILYRFILTIR